MIRPFEHEGRHSFAKNERKTVTMTRLTKYEKETIILTSEDDDTYNVYTFNPTLKRRLADFAKKYPAVCRLESEGKKLGFQSYAIEKARLSIRLTAPYSIERRKTASESAKINLKDRFNNMSQSQANPKREFRDEQEIYFTLR